MSDELRFAGPITMAAIAVMVIATISGRLLFGTDAPMGVVIPLAAVYLGLTTVGWAWCERRGGPALRVLLVATFAVTLALLWSSDPGFYLFLFPTLLMIILHAG